MIREKNQALNFLRLTSRIDAVASRVETAVRMNQVSGGMKNVVKGMEKGLAAMNPEEISKVSHLAIFIDSFILSHYIQYFLDALLILSSHHCVDHG